jgi:class 3 adenylate cyclase
VDERLAIAHELFALASATGDKAAILEAHLYRRVDLAERGDIDAAQRDIDTSLALATELRDQGDISNTSFALVMRPLLEGRFEEAERQMQQALVFGQALGGEGPIILFGAQLAILRQLQGRLAEVEPLIATQMAQYPNIMAYRCALAWIHGETDREEEARAEFDELAGHGFADLPRDGTWLISIYLITELCGYLGDGQRARILYDLLLPYASLNITTGPPGLATGSASRQLGMMATVMGRYEEAERQFEYALAFDKKMNAHPWVAHTQYQYAKLLIARDAPGDKAKALSLLQEALATAQDLGMAKIIERGLALKLEAQGATSSGIYTSIDAVARAVHDERPALPQQAVAPDGTVTIMFSDIEDSTVLTERLGDQAWMELLRKHDALIREQLRAYDGFEVKTIGDAFMVAFRSAKKGLECAVAIQKAFAENGAMLEAGNSTLEGDSSSVQPQASSVRVRIGLHAGEAIKDGDDFYGKNVIMASRVAGKAVGGEILVSSLLRQLVESSVDAGTFGEPREVELKGLSGKHAVYGVSWAAG